MVGHGMRLNWLKWSVVVFVGASIVMADGAGHADDASWMEDHVHLFRNHTLESFSLPASHDAAMYRANLDDLEVDLDLKFVLKNPVNGATVVDVAYRPMVSPTGVEDAINLILDEIRDLLPTFHVSLPCIDYGIGDFCFPSFTVNPSFVTRLIVDEALRPLVDSVLGIPEAMSVTPDQDLYDQLTDGSRIFDLRPKRYDGDLYFHHSQGGLDKGLSKSLDWDIGGYVPCVDRPWPFSGCITGTGRSYHLLSIDLGEVKAEIDNLSGTGAPVDEVLSDIRAFMEAGNRELVILKFSHYWKGDRTSSDFDDLVQRVEDYLSPWLLRSDDLPPGVMPAEALLPELVGESGRVLAAYAQTTCPRVSPDELNPCWQTYTDPAEGIWPPSAVSAGGGSYANEDELAEMESDQTIKFYDSTSDRFDLWWTLTCPSSDLGCSVEGLAGQANPYLTSFVDGLTIPNDSGNTLNEIWVDFVGDTTATEIALRLNTPDPAAMMLCQAAQLSKAASVCKAVFSCYSKRLKNKLKEPVDVRLEACLDQAGDRFSWALETLLAKAEKKDAYCGVEKDPFDGSFLSPIESVVEQDVMADWDPALSSKHERAYRASMLKAGSTLCSGVLAADRRDVRKPDDEKWLEARSRARDKFDSAMDKAAARALRNDVSLGSTDPVHFKEVVEEIADAFSALSEGPL